MPNVPVTVTTVQRTDAARTVLLHCGDDDPIPAGTVTKLGRRSWEVPSGLVYDTEKGAALDQARRFLVHDPRSPFPLGGVDLDFQSPRRARYVESLAALDRAVS